MIRKKHGIDTHLLNSFITERIFDDEINELLINWYSSLGDKNHQITRDSAIAFLEKTSDKVLTEIDYPYRERRELIKIFEPLELLLRTALPLKNPGESSSNVRDHLSHTIRNMLFANHILKKFHPEHYSSLQNQLIIAVIFHDLAYPIEKIKKVAHKLGEVTLKTFLSSKGKVQIELGSTDDLLAMLNFFGNLIQKKENELTENPNDYKKKMLIYKLTHIYREIISKSIAGTGLFDSSHSISSVVLFLMPIIKNSNNNHVYQDSTLNVLSDICLSMTYHDRANLIQQIGLDLEKLPITLRIMRIVDELQEWDREQDSFIKDAFIVNDITTVLTMKLVMKDKNDGTKCDPVKFIPDKINGLLPSLLMTEKIQLSICFPRKTTKKLLNAALRKMNTKLRNKKVELKYHFTGPDKGHKLNIDFFNNEAILHFDTSNLNEKK